MMMPQKQKQHLFGQTSIELAILFMIVIGALISAQIYFKRAVQGRWKTAIDELSDELYDPYLTDSDVTYRTASNSVVEVMTLDDGSDRTLTIRFDETNSLDTRSGEKRIGGYH